MQSKVQIKSIGIDLGKTTFHLIALGTRSQVVIRKKFSRSQLLEYTANLPSSLIGMEAGVGSHFLGRALREQGHEVRLIPAQFVRPFVKSNKNDYCDAEAIAEAVERENMRFVPIKTEDQLDLQALHRVRDRLVARRTSVINQIRAFLLERGISFRKGPASLRRQMPECRRKTQHCHASSVGFLVAGMERPAVADREPEHRARTDCEQRSELCSIAADPRSWSVGVDRGRLCHREWRGFQKGTGVCGLARSGATAMVNRRQGQAAGHQ
jgi:hypothetical protein